ncbi:MAG: glycosyltransferase family 1 protein [Candidatus Diapherotrites archaeon]
MKSDIALVNDFPEGTGIGNYAWNLYKELKEESVEMIYLGGKKKQKRLDFGTLSEALPWPLKRHNLEEEKKKEVKVLSGSIPLPVLGKSLNKALYYPHRVPRGYKLYHASNQFLARLADTRKPCIVSCMDVIPKALPGHYAPGISQVLDYAMQGMKSAEKVIAISNFTKREIEKYYHIPGTKISVIHLGFECDTFSPGNKKRARKALELDEKALIVLNVGSEEPRKGIPTLLKAFQLLNAKYPNSILVRVGEKRPETEKAIANLGLQEKVIHRVKLSKAELALAYNAADVLAFASTYEGFGLPLVEAMASGLPIVAARASSTPEVVKDAAWMVEGGNAIAFCKGLEELLESSAVRNRLKQKGIRRAKFFSWKKCARETQRAYEEVLKK